MGNAYIVDSCRTPPDVSKVGKGALSHLPPSYLGSTVLIALAERNTLNTPGYDIHLAYIDTNRERSLGIGVDYPFTTLQEGECIVPEKFRLVNDTL